MSNITLIVIKGRRISVLQMHWSAAKVLLEQGFDSSIWQKHEKSWAENLDAGYILIDLNTATVVNEQNAFATERF